MVITVKIPDEFAAQARAQGLSLEAYVEKILAQQLMSPATEIRRPRTQEEVHAWLRELRRGAKPAPHLSNQTFSREMIYQDHD